ncbi:MAG TPA: polyphosphate polymerase domain-containing protein [Planctomycetota bacterium]|nr:polyphosphate polymerase domain-containing protein [Planctomycetota bacterium]
MPSTEPYVRSFNRYELKYIVTHAIGQAFLADLAGYCRPDPHADAGHGYPVYSLYWDSRDLDFFWEKIDGEKVRRKLRLRRYGNDSVFVEIKQRIDRTVQKRRVRMPLEQAARVFTHAGVDVEAEHLIDDPVGQEALFLAHRFDLRPTMAVLYRRSAWFGNYDAELRITLDSRLQYDARAKDIREPFETGKYVLSPELSVLEIKYNDRVPVWLTRLVARHQLPIVRYSKYCSAIDQEHFNGAHT